MEELNRYFNSSIFVYHGNNINFTHKKYFTFNKTSIQFVIE